MPLSLSKLISLCDLSSESNLPDIQFTGICSDSRQIQPDDLFIANRGGAQYIVQAVRKGATVVLTDTSVNPNDYQIPVIYCANLSEILNRIASYFYGNAMDQMLLIGTTGTNGKTSTSQYIAQALTRLGQPCGIIGTLGYGLMEHLLPSMHTTPDAIELQKMFAALFDQGAKAVSMEVSSHALDQNRVSGVPFQYAIFTNLTRDHLDYHGTMEAYGFAKQRLFTFPSLRYAVLNADDEFSTQLQHVCSQRKLPVATYSVHGAIKSTADIFVSVQKHRLHGGGIDSDLMTSHGSVSVQLKLLGAFNLANASACLATLLSMGHSLADAAAVLQQIRPVPGRMQCFGGGDKPLAVVDYAHTPDALTKVIQAMRAHGQGQLWLVFGCGGDRDRGKRALMAQVAAVGADHIVITNDNPRHEDPKQIINDIQQGLPQGRANVTVILDRTQAIIFALQQAKSSDMVLVAGKGHEDYQQIADKRYSFSDAQVVMAALNEAEGISTK